MILGAAEDGAVILGDLLRPPPCSPLLLALFSGTVLEPEMVVRRALLFWNRVLNLLHLSLVVKTIGPRLEASISAVLEQLSSCDEIKQETTFILNKNSPEVEPFVSASDGEV